MSEKEQLQRLGELLIEEGAITQEELARAVEEAGMMNTSLAKVLAATSHVKREELAVFLAAKLSIPRFSLKDFNIDPGLAKLVPVESVRKHEMVPLAKLGSVICVGKANYFNRAAVIELRKLTGLKVKVLLCPEDEVMAAIDRLYGAVVLSGTGVPPVKNHGQDAHATSVAPAPAAVAARPVTTAPTTTTIAPPMVAAPPPAARPSVAPTPARQAAISAPTARPAVAVTPDQPAVPVAAPPSASGTGVPPVKNHGQDAHATAAPAVPTTTVPAPGGDTILAALTVLHQAIPITPEAFLNLKDKIEKRPDLVLEAIAASPAPLPAIRIG